MRSGIRLMIVLAAIVALSIAPVAKAIEATPMPDIIGDPIGLVFPQAADGDRATYQGNLRIYMSEPTSRYTDLNGVKYGFGFLNWAGNVGVNILDGEVFTWQTTWDASSNGGFNGVTVGNICAQAILSDPTPHTQYSDPPTGAPFFAYWTDAAAQAIPGAPGQNSTAEGTTHTVFVEEGTQKY